MRKLSFEEITRQRLSPEELATVERFPIYSLLDNIRSLYNVGSIFRTADAVRLSKLYLSGITGYPPRKEIDKTALGAVQTVPWEYQEDPLSLIQRFKKKKIQIVSLEHTTNSKSYRDVNYHFPVCLVLGNEVFGIRDEIIEISDIAVDIPMFGSKQSLNVTIAYGVVIYDILYKYFQQACR
jgi:tRNA G18 (ribose-2'-O)-methylase SpoU